MPSEGTFSIGTNSRDYSTISAWEADTDVSLTGDVVGECYNDSVFDEQFGIGGATSTSSTQNRTLTVASGERHDGTAGTGARVDYSSPGDGSNTFSITEDWFELEWLEITNADLPSGTGEYMVGEFFANTEIKLRNLIIHDVDVGGTGGQIRGLSLVSQTVTEVTNLVMYDLTADDRAWGIRMRNSNASSGAENRVFNCTVRNVSAPTSQGISLSGDADMTYRVKNNAVFDCGVDYSWSTNPTNDSENNASSDGTADDEGGTGHLINQTASNWFQNLTDGSEDFHLQSDAPGVDAGTDLGDVPAKIDIDGGDRHAEDVTWDIGADEEGLTRADNAQPVSAIRQAVYEALQTVAATRVADYESVGVVTVSRSANYESGADVTVVRLSPYEALRALAATREAPYESRLGVSSASEALYEARGQVASSRLAPFEASGVVVASQLAPWESLQGVSATRVGLYESLLTLAAARSGEYEARGKVSRLLTSPYESLQSLSATRTAFYSSRKGVSATSEAFYEFVQGLVADSALLYWDAGYGREPVVGADPAWSRNASGWHEDRRGRYRKKIADQLRYQHRGMPTFGGETRTQPVLLQELARTQQLHDATSPSDQTRSLSSGTYTLSVKGNGSVDASGASDGSYGTASEGGPLTFTVTSQQNVNFTVTGSVDRFQCEAGNFPTTVIDSGSSSVTRSVDHFRFQGAPGPRDLALYVAFVEQGAVGGAPVIFLGDAPNGSNPYLRLLRSGGDYVWAKHNGSQTVSVNLGAAASRGTLVESVVYTDESEFVGYRSDDVAAATRASTSDVSHPGSWSADATYLNRQAATYAAAEYGQIKGLKGEDTRPYEDPDRMLREMRRYILTGRGEYMEAGLS